MCTNSHADTVRFDMQDFVNVEPISEYILANEPGLGDEHLYFDLP